MELEPALFFTFVNVDKSLHYSYMELELAISTAKPGSCHIITLFLYGIGAKYIVFITPENILYYIIPIWNWSSFWYFHNSINLCTLHYSYMELELFQIYQSFHLLNNYIIPIWNWSILLGYCLSN